MIIPNPRTPIGGPPMPVGPDRGGAPAFRPWGARFYGSMKKGGKVKKTGLYKLHKGERVMPTKLSSLVKA